MLSGQGRHTERISLVSSVPSYKPGTSLWSRVPAEFSCQQGAFFPQFLTGSSFSEKQEYCTKMLLPCLSYVQLLELRLYSKGYKLTDMSNLQQPATTMSQTEICCQVHSELHESPSLSLWYLYQFCILPHDEKRAATLGGY